MRRARAARRHSPPLASSRLAPRPCRRDAPLALARAPRVATRVSVGACSGGRRGVVLPSIVRICAARVIARALAARSVVRVSPPRPLRRGAPVFPDSRTRLSFRGAWLTPRPCRRDEPLALARAPRVATRVSVGACSGGRRGVVLPSIVRICAARVIARALAARSVVRVSPPRPLRRGIHLFQALALRARERCAEHGCVDR